RIKEEIGAGKDVKYAIRGGFDKALSAIVDGNVTTLIAAAVLWLKGSGSVKGFAQTLAIGIVLSMFTALVITKLLIHCFYAFGAKNPKLYGSKKPVKVRNWVKVSKFCGLVSAILIIIGLVFLPINKKNTGNVLNYSLDFSGGTSVTVTFDADTELSDELKTTIKDQIAEVVDDNKIEVQAVEEEKQLNFKTTKEMTNENRIAVEEALKNEENSYKVGEIETETITSSISDEMKTDAAVAVIIAAILMLIYIAIRFKDIRFGAGAVIALMHDVLMVFAIYSVFKLSVGGNFIACMLTIVGYSINATIIIYDRIRENMKAMSIRKDGLEAIVNTSISQTFSRTINTSITTLITITLLFIMGVSSIKEFAFTIMAGVIIGAYSSVTITGPLWYLLKSKIGGKKTAK
ncbi:MAG: protein translocase subunit SecF, partial [Lachnospiraceae bacterium]